MGARGEVVQTPAPWSTLPAAAAWLLGYVRTDAPGYREVSRANVGLAVLASGEHRFDAYVSAYSTAWQTLGGDAATWETTGRVVGTGDVPTFTDRTGYVLGFGDVVGQYYSDDSTPFVPPAGIPLMGTTWTRVDSEADRRTIFDRHRRNQGYMWGGATVYRCKLTMHRWALEALQTGWCLRGKVTLGCVGQLDTPVSPSEPTGAITGHALGLDSVRWLDSIQQTAVVEMSIVTA